MLVIFLLAVALNEVPELPEISPTDPGIELPEFVPIFPGSPLVPTPIEPEEESEPEILPDDMRIASDDTA